MVLKPVSNERRRRPRRRNAGATVKFRRLKTRPDGTPDRYHEGHLMDITREGMCFYSDVPLDAGEKIDFTVTSAAGDPVAEGAGRIAHAHTTAGLHYAGVQFIR
jgi:hypothetical protein